MNDLDFSFYIADGSRFLDILEIEEDVLVELLTKSNVVMSWRDVYDNFFLDSVKVENQSGGAPKESWSLITIGKKGSQTIDIKFVFKSKRSYVFSADSFEVVLDPLFQTNQRKDDQIQVESMFGDYGEALAHLKRNILCTVQPEEIRRGIFRYCLELAKGKKPSSEKDRSELDQVFTAALIGEEHMNFEDVLAKFLLKHSSNASAFLEQFLATLQRSANDKQIIERFTSTIQKFQELHLNPECKDL
jgi:hypothetical protein